eukprot:229940-Prymnesium_polylepis.1
MFWLVREVLSSSATYCGNMRVRAVSSSKKKKKEARLSPNRARMPRVGLSVRIVFFFFIIIIIDRQSGEVVLNPGHCLTAEFPHISHKPAGLA